MDTEHNSWFSRLLKKAEKVTKTDLTYLFKGGFWITLGQGVSALSGLLLSYAFANFVDPTSFGTYRFVLSITGMLAAITLPGLSTALVRAVVHNEKGVLRYSFIQRMKWGVLASLGALTGAGYYFFVGNNEIAIALLVGALFLPLLDPVQMYSAYLSGKKDFKRTSMFTAIAHISGSLFLLCAIYFTPHFIVLIITYFAGYTLTHGLMLRYVLLQYTEHSEGDSSHKDTLQYGKHLSYINGFYIVSTQLDKILVFHFLGAVELAVYTFASLFPDYVRNMTRTVATVALPKFAERTLGEIKHTIYIRMALFGVFLLFIAGAYALIAPYIFAWFFPFYLSSIPYSQLLALTILGALVTIPNTILRAHKQVKELYTIQMVGSIIQIGFLVVGVIFYGIIGVIVARILARLAQTLFGVLLLRKTLHSH